MKFTHDMLERLSPQEKLLLNALFEKASEPLSHEKTPEWQWTLKGPATEEQSLRSRKVGLSPRLTAGTTKAGGPLLEVLTLTEGRG